MQFTDLDGNAKSKDLKLQRNSLSYNYGFVMINIGYVAYEIKTYNPNNSTSVLFKAFVEGCNQTIARAYFRNITAGVLVFDKSAFFNLYNDPAYHSRVDAVMQQMNNLININGEQAVFLRLEDNLWLESNNAYFALVSQIQNL